ncbi:outer membrane beta-barrel protein [Fibrobacter sp. UWB11]|uniref:outer membrane beta-barrel protein n=1 Tax=Fibrobacter sp. UWB11 TaxID=1896202 RepID=UPI0009408EE2|nr:outer membrane beta-barrel protein [Fibrobacter sp. UWB11]
MAVLETLSPKELLTRQERMYLADILRGEAVRILPAEQNWTIMTRENINVMLPPGKSIEDCEGSCLAETGRNIAADYVAQARVSQFGKSLAITAELYETATSKLIASFVGKGETVEDLEKIIKEQAPAFFRKSRDNAMPFGYVNTNNSFSFQGPKKFIIDIQTTPIGAIPTFDGRANPQCTSTPCRIQLEGGEHRIVFSKERFDDLDTIINVIENGQAVNANLVPNVSFIKIAPQIADELQTRGSTSVVIDGRKANWGVNELIPGIHTVRITHSCHDPIELNVSIQKNETKTISDSLKRGIGGLELEVFKNGVPQAVPVFIDDNAAGTTPFASEVPLCAKIEIENEGNREQVPVEIKWHEVIKKSYEIKEQKPAVITKADETRQKAEVAYAELDGKKVAANANKTNDTTSNKPKRIWGGVTAGITYNDFYSTKFGLNDIKHGTAYSPSISGADDLLSNYWGVGFKVGFSGMFLQSQYFNLRGDLNLALRQGTGKTNSTVTLSWKDSDKSEKSDLEIEYSSTQLNIDLPILARVSIPNTIYFEAGPMFSFNIYSNSEAKITDVYGTETYKDNGGLSAFEFDIATGIGISRSIGKSMLDFDLRFIFGITRLSDSKDSPKTWQGQLNVTYWFL